MRALDCGFGWTLEIRTTILIFHRKRSGHKIHDASITFVKSHTSSIHYIHMDIEMSYFGLTHLGEGITISVRFQKTQDALMAVILSAR